MQPSSGQFDHRPDEHNQLLIRCTCRYCHSLVGASADWRNLRIMEEAHQCPDLRSGIKSMLRQPPPSRNSSR
ncbi:MAG TPA: hypothetical protein VFU76_15595 [Terriglobales bacterium]|nr:hypothetical protein [Terriglobales bacterium]